MKSSLRQQFTKGKSMGHLTIPSPEKNLSAISDDVESLSIRKELSELSLIEDDQKATCIGKLIRIYNKPLLFIRDLTMPPFHEHKWNIAKTMVTPFLGLLFLIWQFDLLQTMISRWYFTLVYILITLPISAWIVIRGWRRNLVVYHAGKFAFFTFIVSVMWLAFVAHCFMDFLSLLTVASGLPLEYLSLTILAWGNSLDDFFIDYVICKAGHGKMAVTGLFAGQLFNLLVGVGGSMFRSSLTNTVHPGIYNFEGENFIPSLLVVVLIFSLLLCLFSILIYAKMNHWNFTKRMMVFVLVYYGVFMTTVTAISLI